MEAPFKVGQKVIAIANSNSGVTFKKGEIYTVLGLYSCRCGKWSIDIGFKIKRGDGTACSDCGNQNINYGNEWLCTSKKFAPLPEQRERINYVAVSETLRETAVEIAAIETN